MIREFFAPRVFMIFAAIWFVIAALLAIWLHASKRVRGRWLTTAKIPVIATVVAGVISAILVSFIVLLD